MKKLLISALLLPMIALADPMTSRELKVVCGSGHDNGIKIVGTNQYAPFITINDGLTTIFDVNYQGAVAINATNAKVIFGSTNTAPVTTNVVVAWVAVSVKGDTNAYRLPLYK